MVKVIIVHRSIIKYRGSIYVLYPAREDREKLRRLHGKKVHAILIVENETQQMS